MDPRVVLVQDSLEFARQVNSDQGRFTMRVVNNLSHQLGWRPPLVIRDEEVGRFLKAGGLADATCLVVPSNAARHADSPVRAAMTECATEIEEAIDSHVGALILHQYSQKFPPWRQLVDVTLSQDPTAEFNDVVFGRDYTAVLPTPLPGRLLSTDANSLAAPRPIAWKSINVPGDGTWRPLARRRVDQAVLAARLNRGGRAVIISSLPLDWIGAREPFENWLVAAVLGKPVASRLSREVHTAPAIVEWRLSQAQIDWLRSDDPSEEFAYLGDGRPLDLVVPAGYLSSTQARAIARRGFRCVELEGDANGTTSRTVITDSSRLSLLGTQLAATLRTHSQEIDGLLASPSQDIFPLRNLLGAVALLSAHSLELRTECDLVIETDRLATCLARLPYEGMTLSSISAAIQCLAFTKLISRSPEVTRGALEAARRLSDLLPEEVSLTQTKAATQVALAHLSLAPGQFEVLTPSSDTSWTETSDDAARAREVLHVVSWCLGHPLGNDLGGDVCELTWQHEVLLETGSAEYRLRRLLSELPSSQTKGPYRVPPTALEDVNELELTLEGANSLGRVVSISMGLAWAYSNGVQVPLRIPELSRHAQDGATTSGDLSRIRELEAEARESQRLVALGRIAAIGLGTASAVLGCAAAATLVREGIAPPWAGITLGVISIATGLEIVAWFSLLPKSLKRARLWFRQAALQRSQDAG